MAEERAYPYMATVRDPERKRDWEAMFGTDTVPIKSPLPDWAVVPGVGRTLVYELNLAVITAAQRERLVEYVTARFGYAATEVEDRLDAEGMPILSNEVVVTGYDLRLFL